MSICDLVTSHFGFHDRVLVLSVPFLCKPVLFTSSFKSKPYPEAIKGNEKAMNRNCSNQKTNPTLKTKIGNI